MQEKEMDWQRLISNKRLGQELRHTERHDERTEFKRDYDRLIFSAPFRRLQNKTQVFPLPGSVFVHNRLTHSLEVASVGMSLGNDVARAIIKRNPDYAGTVIEELGTIVSSACLAHDLGNPPFGHSGEKAIQTFFSEGVGLKLKDDLSPELWNDITHFEGNANAFRLLTHKYSGRRDGGFVMTYSMLASIVKYPFASYYSGTPVVGGKEKFGFFLEAFRYGTPPHGGVGIGLERLTMVLADTENIRDVVAFPTTNSSLDLMSESPNYVDDSQLEVLGIKVEDNKKDQD